MSRITTISSIVAILLLTGAAVAQTFIILKASPIANSWHIALFYSTSFVFAGSLTYLIGFGLRRTFGMRELVRNHFIISLRESVLFAVLVCCVLLMFHFGVFNWINASLLAGALIFLEAYFLFK